MRQKEWLLDFKWTVSRGRDTYGYNICSLWVDGRKVSACNGGGYDMEGTSLGIWAARMFRDRLLTLREPFYGLCFIDPSFDPGKVVFNYAPVFGKDEDSGKTVEQLEAEGKSLGLERYQASYFGTSKTPTEKHIYPEIDGACGKSSVQAILNAIGLSMVFVKQSKNETIYLLVDNK